MVTERKEWTLTREAFEQLLGFLHSDPTQAPAEYENVRSRLMKLFRWRGCLSFEEYADETIDRVARRISTGAEVTTTNPYALFYGVAMNVLREHWRRLERESNLKGELAQSNMSSPNPEELNARRDDEREIQLRSKCVRLCLSELSEQNLTIIKKYYAEGDILNKEARKQLADGFKISVSTLRVRAFRVRAEVEKCARICVTQAER